MPNHLPLTPEQIDALLPQTQCGLCGYGGCLPYAEAICYEQAPIHLCPPGGVSTLKKLGELLGQDPTPYLAEMAQKAKPQQVAVIREAECIGCTKCIQACPVDAILGSAKQMHTVITAACTGCELCVPPCPVDCIELLIQPNEVGEDKKNIARARFNARQQRLAKDRQTQQSRLEKISLSKKRSYIQSAIERVSKKREKNF